MALARALVNRPRVLLLDEPLGALDRKLREEMQIELKLLQSQLGITFIFVTHDQEEAMSMSDRIAVMLDGHVEQLADPDTIYERPASAFVAGFIGQQQLLAGRDGADGHELARRRLHRDRGPCGTDERRAGRPRHSRPCGRRRSTLAADRPGRAVNARAGQAGRRLPPR